MDFAKTLKNYHIAYLPELPSEDIKVEENTVIAIPGEKKEQFKLYTWYENEWVYTAFIDKSDSDLKEFKDAYDDLNNAVKRLIKISAKTENDELKSKLSKITTKILQAKYELSDDVIDPFEKTCNAEKDYKRAEQYFEHRLEESLKNKELKMDSKENLEKISNYINEKIKKYVENTVVAVDTANTPKVNYWCGYIKALEDLKDFLGLCDED